MICMISRIVRLNTEEAYSNIVLDILPINGYEVSIFVASCVLSSTKFIWSSALHSWMHWPMFTTILESLLCHRHLHFRQLPAGILNTCFYVPLSSSLLVMVLLRFFMAIILPQNVIVTIACNSEYNQEDSVTMKQPSKDHDSFYHYSSFHIGSKSLISFQYLILLIPPCFPRIRKKKTGGLIREDFPQPDTARTILSLVGHQSQQQLFYRHVVGFFRKIG